MLTRARGILEVMWPTVAAARPRQFGRDMLMRQELTLSVQV